MEQKQFEEVLSYYFDGECQIKQGPSGMNNLTRYVKHNDKQYVLRIYQNHADINAVKMEHKILQQLKHLNVSCPIEMKNGGTIAKMGDHLATVFMYREGVNLKLEMPIQYYDFGKTVGQLSLHLEKIECHSGEYSPYYKLDEGYPNHGAAQFCDNIADEFIDVREKLQRIKELLDEIEHQNAVLETLPQQLIHGDINCSNLLMNDEGMISSVLDFEFVTKDLRVMEVAICLSELLHEVEGQEVPKFEEYLNLFCQGYRSQVKLSDKEIEMLPTLILLRRLDVFLHFMVRYEKGIKTENIDSVTFLKKQIRSIAFQDQWLSQKGNQVKKLFK